MTVPQAVEQSLWDEPPFSTILALLRQAGHGAGRPAHPQGRRPHPRYRAGQRRPAGPSRPQGQHAGQPLPPRLQRRSPRVPGPGHRPRHRRRRRRRAADPPSGRRNSTAKRTSCSWRASISNRHLVELPVRFAPKPQQDVMARPAYAVPSQRPSDWQVGTPQPQRRLRSPLLRPAARDADAGARTGRPSRACSGASSAGGAASEADRRTGATRPAHSSYDDQARSTRGLTNRCSRPVTGSVNSSTRASSWSGRRKSPAGTGAVTTG